MTRRPSTFFLAGIAALGLGFGAMLLHATQGAASARPHLARNAALVARLELTDLCLFTEAQYTRHPSLSDLATPFQDAPLSLEHFPSGALLQPPPHLTGGVRD